MSNSTTKPPRLSFVEFLTQHRSPTAIAAGVSTGIAMGLVPRDSALSLVFLGIIAFTPMNQLVACTTAVLTSFISIWGSQLVHQAGFETLRLPLVSGIIASLYTLPLVPWFRLENTMVTGGLVCGFLAWLPSFLLARYFCRVAEQKIQSHQVYELAAAAIRRQRSEEESATTVPANASMAATQPTTIPRPVAADLTSVSRTDGDATSVTEMPEAAIAKRPKKDSSRKTTSTAPIKPVIAFEDSVLRETVIEVVRYKRPILDTSSQSAVSTGSDSTLPIRDTMPLASTTSASTASALQVEGSGSTRSSERVASDTKVMGVNSTTIHVVNLPINKEESLRHILKHIHGTRESRKSSEKSA